MRGSPVWFVGWPESPASLFRALRAIRDALAVLTGEMPTSQVARVYAEAAQSNGYAYLGVTPEDPEALKEAKAAVEAAGFELLTDMPEANVKAYVERGNAAPTPEQVFDAGNRLAGAPVAEPEPQAEVEPRVSFSPEAYETAIALMHTTDGKPLVSCAHARTLAYSTGDFELYAEVILVLAKVFRPWLPEMIEQAQLRIETEE